jgi:hypothetical protein
MCTLLAVEEACLLLAGWSSVLCSLGVEADMERRFGGSSVLWCLIESKDLLLSRVLLVAAKA